MVCVLAVLEDLEIARLKIADRLSLAVANGDVHEDQVDAAPELRRLTGLIAQHGRRREDQRQPERDEEIGCMAQNLIRVASVIVRIGANRVTWPNVFELTLVSMAVQRVVLNRLFALIVQADAARAADAHVARELRVDDVAARPDDDVARRRAERPDRRQRRTRPC